MGYGFIFCIFCVNYMGSDLENENSLSAWRYSGWLFGVKGMNNQTNEKWCLGLKPQPTRLRVAVYGSGDGEKTGWH